MSSELSEGTHTNSGDDVVGEEDDDDAAAAKLLKAEVEAEAVSGRFFPCLTYVTVLSFVL